MNKFEVSADWMKACGLGDEAKAFNVIRSYERGFLPFVDLDRDGIEWTVCAEWRGRYI